MVTFAVKLSIGPVKGYNYFFFLGGGGYFYPTKRNRTL